MDQTLVLNLNQAAIDGIRAAGATSQYIFVEGNAWTGAWSWTSNNDNMKGLTDPQDKIVYEMHQYLDSDSSGTSETCVSSTIGQERLESATTWLKDNGKKGFIGEFAGGVNSVCESAVEGMLSYMSENTDVWMGAEWWAAGPWWGSYMYSLEPTDGPAYSTYLPILEKYFVSGSSSSSSSSSSSTSTTSSSSSTTTAAATVATTSATTTAVQHTTTSTSTTAPVEVASAPNSQVEVSSPAAQTTTVPAATTTLITKTSSTQSNISTAASCSTTGAAAGTVPHWYQCGGLNWTGATACESGYTCVEQNPYYSQCL
jgi:endoglucanase